MGIWEPWDRLDTNPWYIPGLIQVSLYGSIPAVAQNDSPCAAE